MDGGPWSRVIVEKPFGRDLATARALNEELSHVFGERQIFRIDHYLGKETAQNILVLRFGNGIFEPLWNRQYVDHVQITVAESIGVEKRGPLSTKRPGVLRDIIQNHLLQLLCARRDGAARSRSTPTPCATRRSRCSSAASDPQTPDEICATRCAASTPPGPSTGEPVPGYRAGEGRRPTSSARRSPPGRSQIDNWRWAGVPFYLRAGKRLAKRVTEIAIHFKPPPISLFRQIAGDAARSRTLSSSGSSPTRASR